MSIQNLIIYGLAVWRIASIFVRERGPFDLFLKLRKRVGIQHDNSGNPVGIPDGFLPGVFSCVWCASVWIGFFFATIWVVSPEWSLKFSVPFALSAVAIFVDSWIERQNA